MNQSPKVVIRSSSEVKPRPESYHPSHKLMDLLRDLQIRMEHTAGQDRGMNVIEAYDTFIRANKTGRSCIYALKCRTLFMNQDFKEIGKLIKDISDVIYELEHPEETGVM